MNQNELTHNKFQHIHKVLSSQSFLKMDALNGEIPFWIAPYDIAAQNQVEQEIANLTVKLENNGIKTLLVDLFELSCQLIDENIGLNEMFELELEMEKTDFKDAIQSTINIHERFIPAIVEKVASTTPKILLLKGIGAVYPFIRSHTVLNNLQSAVKNIPTVMFFCGSYTGQSLNLFGTLKDDNYYRAFNIDTYKQKA
ncbi:MAG: DUF1788 domain-containing protein [Chitinophagia bacterium]|nr:DUF1788 domain-containing protein [Chitinophagia bacterium]